jgi:hypothetical protein
MERAAECAEAIRSGDLGALNRLAEVFAGARAKMERE